MKWTTNSGWHVWKLWHRRGGHISSSGPACAGTPEPEHPVSHALRQKLTEVQKFVSAENLAAKAFPHVDGRRHMAAIHVDGRRSEVVTGWERPMQSAMFEEIRILMISIPGSLGCGMKCLFLKRRKPPYCKPWAEA